MNVTISPSQITECLAKKFGIVGQLDCPGWENFLGTRLILHLLILAPRHAKNVHLAVCKQAGKNVFGGRVMFCFNSPVYC